MSVFSMRPSVSKINGPMFHAIAAKNLKVGDVIHLPVVQRLVVKEIVPASEGAVIVGEPMLVLQCEGQEGVFHNKAAAPIVVPMNATLSVVVPEFSPESN